MRFAAIILAAGYSRRFGSDKRLACINGQPMLLATLRNVRAAIAGVSNADLQVVIRAQDPVVAPMLVGIISGSGESPGCLVQAPTWPVGIGASIATGVEALLSRGCRPDSVAICLGDMPLVQPNTLRRLLYASRPRSICVPVYRRERGHPLVFGRHFFPELMQLRGNRGVEKLLRTHAKAVREFAVDDPGVTLDFDRPADFRAAVRPDQAGRNGTARGTAAGGFLASSQR